MILPQFLLSFQLSGSSFDKREENTIALNTGNKRLDHTVEDIVCPIKGTTFIAAESRLVIKRISSH